LHVLATGERDGYYADHAAQPLADFGRALAEGFVYQGQWSAYRERPRGEPSAALPPTAFVNFLQNHDQVGNRAYGDRLVHGVPARRLRALTACVLLAPAPPLLFMGEEFGASAPFLFFCDFGAELADAVREGRRAEFRRHAAFADPAARERIPDPNAVATFERSKLDWSERTRGEHAQWLALYRELLGLRRRWIVPNLLRAEQGGRSQTPQLGVLVVEWPLGDRVLRLAAHLPERDDAAAVTVPHGAGGALIYASEGVVEQMSEQMSEQASVRTNAQANAQAGRRIGDQMSKPMGEQMRAPMSEQMSQQMGEQTNAQRSEQMSPRSHALLLPPWSVHWSLRTQPPASTEAAP
jgi:maltooligosyltrehalose trehalohydrolase